MPEIPLPERVQTATDKAASVGFDLSSDPNIGRMLRTLAAAVRPNGRILEIGTGLGVGTAWLIEGVGARTDVEIVTVESDPHRAQLAEENGWPSFVKPVVGDALVIVPTVGLFSLVFADAEGGKIYGLDSTLNSLERNGLLILDDMRFCGRSPAIEEGVVQVRKRLLADDRFVCAEMNWSSGLLVATKVK